MGKVRAQISSCATTPAISTSEGELNDTLEAIKAQADKAKENPFAALDKRTEKQSRH